MITGNFNEFIIFLIIILIHELGHILTAVYYKWSIQEVILLPFGALTVFNEKINRPLKEEFLIAIMGPVFQIFFTLIFNNPKIQNYSTIILFFNMLPIYPLDGSKILNIILNKFISFKKSHLVTLYTSILIIILIIIKVEFSLILILIFLFISIKVIEEIKNHHKIFNKFLLERYLYDFNFKKQKIITNIKKMKRDYRHILKSKKIYKTERQFLKEMFDFKRKL